MRESTESSDDVPVLHRKFNHPLVGEFFEERNGSVLDAEVFAVHHGHQHELPVGELFMVDKTALNTLKTQPKGRFIT